ncbi:uncharacterized protein LACBIDRAFT_307495 [Laccaria bicolor S238N-H82]|uniref:Predicted protein n=1 Tax=Laccaria bicolor (strain S238N-H82 / ATCC MYA-4686) TaxID=486041 RepID=B0DQA1_LACBS|nr:uncharacterized protein LACBIDRAFT_307495 [Laccaria bicolor S238N-H82]EDR03258.1 predicted protein [Laccaria bicolor S238N-H82]|eukprot:XP_001886054.1 predicted protein [Laccaria bicolor S238N-H82]
MSIISDIINGTLSTDHYMSTWWPCSTSCNQSTVASRWLNRIPHSPLYKGASISFLLSPLLPVFVSPLFFVALNAYMNPPSTIKTAKLIAIPRTRLQRRFPISLPFKFPWKMNSPHFLQRVMSLGDASRILYDQEDDADSSTDVDSSDEVTLISHEPLPLLPKLNKFEDHPQFLKPLYPTPTRQRSFPVKIQTHQVHPHLSQPNLLTNPSVKSIYARKIQPTAPSNPNPTPSTYTAPQNSHPSGSPWLPSAYPRSPAEPHYHILPDDLSSQNTALSPPPWHQGGKVSYERLDHTFCPIHHAAQPCWSCDRARNGYANEELRFPF